MSKLRYFFTIYLKVVISFALFPTEYCQAQYADSLMASLPQGMEVVKKVDTLNQIGFNLIFTDPFESRIIFNEAIALTEDAGYIQGHAKALKNKAISYDIQGNSNQAIIYYQQSLALLEPLQDTLGISRLKNNLGIAYKNLDDFEMAQKFYGESIVLKKLLGDVKGVAYGLNNIGELFQKRGAFEKAQGYFAKAYFIVDSIGDNRGRSITLSNLAISFLELEEYDLAITNLERSMLLDEQSEDYYSLSYSYLLLAKAYLNTCKLEEGLEAVEKGERLSQEIGALKVYYDSQVLKARLMKRAGDTKDLPDLYEEILILNDSLAHVNLIEETAKMKSIYESREKELVIADLNKKSMLSQRLMEAQQQVFKLSLVAVLILAVLLLIVYVLYRKVGTKKRELEIKIIERNTAKKEAERASKVKSQFLAQMSHEIRTPLNAVIGYTDQVIETTLNETQSDHLMIVKKSALGLLGIINGILDFSKLEVGKLDLVVEHTDLEDLCQHAIQMSGYKASENDLKLNFNGIDRKYRYVLADDIRLRQVLLNLLSNATKFTKKGEIELTVMVLEEKEDGKGLFSFAVRDTGIGIQPEALEKIFRAFSQEDATTTRRYGGTGLGLSISNNLLSLMGSKLEVLSTPGEGSTFSFDIFLELSDVRSTKGVAPKKPGLEPQSSNRVVSTSDKLKVLIAEDNTTNMILAKMLLKKALPNAKIIEAENGLEAVSLFVEVQPDVIFMDVQMPEMDGYTATKKIRALEQSLDTKTPVIALTAGSMEADKERCYAAGMDDFVSKPIVNDALATALRKWVVD